MTRWLAAFAFLLAATSAASACKCATMPRAKAIAFTPIVFTGRITGIKTDGSKQVTTMSVVRRIKGRVDPTVKVFSTTLVAACGLDFRKVKGTITVGGSGSSSSISIHRCAMYNFHW